MMPIFLAAVEAAAASAEPDMIQKFGIEPKFIAMQVVSFVILFAVLYKFGIKPTVATMEERNAKIAAGLKHAEETQARLTAAAQESAQIVKTAQLEAQRVVDEARKIAKEFYDKQQAEAIVNANALIAKAKQSNELEYKKMLDQARTEIARLVVATTERVLAKKLSDTDRAAYNDTAARELNSV